MAWFITDDGFLDHPKVSHALSLNPLTIALWQLSGVWSSRNLTDGFVPAYQIDRFLPAKTKPNSVVLAGMLVTAGLWEVADGGWLFHDWKDWNRSRDTVLADRETAKKRMQTLRSGRKTDTRSGPVRPNTSEHRPNVREKFGECSRPKTLTLTDDSFVVIDDDDPQPGDNRSRIADLAAGMRQAGMPVRTDRLTPDQTAQLDQLIDLHDMPRLVDTAKRVWRQDKPAEHIQALLGAWTALPAPGSRLRLVERWCETHAAHYTAAACPACVIDSKVAG